MPPRKKRISIPLIMSGIPAVILLGYYCAAGMSPHATIFAWYDEMQVILKQPFVPYLSAYTLRTILIFLLIYLFFVFMYITGQKNYLHGREMGSAQYADVKQVNRKLADKSKSIHDPKNIVIRKKKRGKSYC